MTGLFDLKDQILNIRRDPCLSVFQISGKEVIRYTIHHSSYIFFFPLDIVSNGLDTKAFKALILVPHSFSIGFEEQGRSSVLYL